jgi:hypothetical protein
MEPLLFFSQGFHSKEDRVMGLFAEQFNAEATATRWLGHLQLQVLQLVNVGRFFGSLRFVEPQMVVAHFGVDLAPSRVFGLALLAPSLFQDIFVGCRGGGGGGIGGGVVGLLAGSLGLGAGLLDRRFAGLFFRWQPRARRPHSKQLGRVVFGQARKSV